MPTLLQTAALKLRDEFLATGTHRAQCRTPSSGLCGLISSMFQDSLLSLGEVGVLEAAIKREIAAYPSEAGWRRAYLTSAWRDHGMYGLRHGDDGPVENFKARAGWLGELVLGQHAA